MKSSHHVPIAAMSGALTWSATSDREAVDSRRGIDVVRSAAVMPSQPTPTGPLREQYSDASGFAAASWTDAADVFAADRSGTPGARTEESEARRTGAQARMTRAVARLAAVGGHQPVELIAAYDRSDAAAGDAEADRISDPGGKLTRTFTHLPLRGITLPTSALTTFAEKRAVRVIDLDAEVRASSVAAREPAMLPASTVPEHWPVATGIGVAVIDSGVTAHNNISVAGHYDCESDPLAGVVVVASAGNFPIASPGNSRKIITVGYLWADSTPTHAGDQETDS